MYNIHIDLCKYILENIADKNPISHNGDTPLHYAAMGGNLNVCKLIMANIDALEIKNLQNQTPMDVAHIRACEDVMKRNGTMRTISRTPHISEHCRPVARKSKHIIQRLRIVG